MELKRSNDYAYRNLHREINLMQKLDHPNVVRLLDVAETERTLLLIMEYAGGGEIFGHLVAHGRVSEEKSGQFLAQKWFGQLVEAVRYCHKAGVVHRDLKSENLLLDAEQNVKVSDFGLSHTFVHHDILSTFCGSPAYAAPEILKGTPYSGPEADIWSLGVTLFVLVCGFVPFDPKNGRLLLKRAAIADYRLPEWVSKDCADLISHLMVPDPAKRMPLDEVRKHRWLRPFFSASTPPEGVLPGASVSIDEDVLTVMTRLGYKSETVVQKVHDGSCDATTTTYRLLLRQAEVYRNSKQLPHVVGVVSRSLGFAPAMSVFEQVIERKPIQEPGVLRAPTPPLPEKKSPPVSLITENYSTPTPHKPKPMVLMDEEDAEQMGADRRQSGIRSLFGFRSKAKSPAPSTEVRFCANANLASSKPPEEILEIIRSTLVAERIPFTTNNGPWLLECKMRAAASEGDQKQEVIVELEICRLAQMSLYGVRARRVSGNPFAFVRAAQMVLAKLIL